MRRKLFLSTLAIVLLTLALSMFSVNFVYKKEFGNYLTHTTEAALEPLPQRLLSAYKNTSWDQITLDKIGESLPLGTQVTLQDPNGNVIAILKNSMDSMHENMSDTHLENATVADMMNMPYSVQGWKTRTITIAKEQKTLATALLRYPTSARILNPADTSFMTSVFYSLIMASGLALLIGILLIYFTSKQLVAPLQKLTQAAFRIGQGYLEERVSSSTKDEVGQLAEAFNTMADNLKHQEELRKQFTADIAHELRTPLTSIRSYIEAFQDGVLPANSENFSALNEEIDRLVGLSSDLKDLNIAEIGVLRVNPLPVNLNDIIDKVTHNLYPLLKEKELNLSWAPLPQPTNILGDERLLTRLFYNLIHNAYKFTESGGTIQITMQAGQDNIDVQVRDTGIGIPENDLPYVFERFYRTDKSRARETGGSGIGLALVRQIVLLHNGKISIESTVGLGTTFKVTLPRKNG
ncbi:HAMP domain-containing sensor histidine kinase [Desulfitobacterium sp.]|uniref:sensor histidine kinase n=1 Tax=Desulfitobacterium sp. TaxID=49981 RepID=UPI002B96E66B|nr:HAMP domain-containing sensor histidine kinase [Desulfitobacterium sp.]HVJ47712.1 HAMP domain-containing sensor histidine kinase [Desulfitobacterium sp.]